MLWGPVLAEPGEEGRALWATSGSGPSPFFPPKEHLVSGTQPLRLLVQDPDKRCVWP